MFSLHQNLTGKTKDNKLSQHGAVPFVPTCSSRREVRYELSNVLPFQPQYSCSQSLQKSVVLNQSQFKDK